MAGKYFTLFLVVFLLLMKDLAFSQETTEYRQPPGDMIKIIDAPQTPSVSVSPDREWMLLLDKPAYPSIRVLSQPELKLAGTRLNPANLAPSRNFNFDGLKLKNLWTYEEPSISGLPKMLSVSNISWSPDSKKLAFTNTLDNTIELWIIYTDSLKAKKITDLELIGIMGAAYTWLSDSKTLIVKAKPNGKGTPPAADPVPKGPVVSVSDGKPAPLRTYQDLLQSPYDEQLFDYYFDSQLYKVTIDGKIEKFLPNGIYRSFQPSPDGKYILTARINKPYSYLVPWDRFPMTVEMFDIEGNSVKVIENVPLTESLPKGFDAVRTGKRGFSWRADADAELYWAEAADGGNPETTAEIRDSIFSLKAPFDGEPVFVAGLKYRYGGITWGSGKTAILYDGWWKTRRETRYLFAPDEINPGQDNKTVLFDLNTEDRYANPGDFITKPMARGFHVLLAGQTRSILFLFGQGASPRGDIPFMSMFNLDDKVRIKVWESESLYYETPLSVINMNKKLILTRRESVEEPPNYCLRDLNTKTFKKLTDYPHPYPFLKKAEKRVLRYKREDGVDLTADLYLPPGYKEGVKLPVLMWAYPSEFKSKSAAGQVKDSPYKFIRVSAMSPLFWLTQGYAVLDDPSMPIIGEGKTEPNDTYVQQLQMDAKAIVNHIVTLGIADSARIAFGGHSYGAFTTANLRAHTDLFAAGIARSGAYNRTLTPFGFQSEERTFWEAPVQYIEMSPFMFADKIKEPILLIHGAEDNNSGTFPMQSERFFSALKGHGATARLVLLPKESHGYMARESLFHMLWEMDKWLEKYVKNK